MEAGLPCHHGKGHGSGAASAAALQVLPAQQLTLPLQLMVPLHCISTAACLYAQVRPENCSLRGLYLMELPSYLMHGNAPVIKTVLLLPHFKYLDLYLCIVQCTASRRAWL